MILEEMRAPFTMMKPLIDLKDDPETFEKAKADDAVSQIREMFIGQVVSLDDAKRMLEIAQPIGAMDCMCRRNVRATLEDGVNRPYSCLGVGVGLLRWEEWPERYKGGVEFLSTDEAKRYVEHWHKRGMVITVMTFGTPYIGGVCLCDYPDCLAIRLRLDYGIKQPLWKGHEVAKVDYDECTGCGDCVARCQFGAMRMEVTTRKVNIDMTRCFGCGACAMACSQEAIRLVDREKLPALREVW